MSTKQIRRWRANLAEERAEAAIYRKLAEKKTGEERDILLALAEAEKRHEAHWLELLGDDVGKPVKASLRTRILGLLATLFGSVFALALMQYSEERASGRSTEDVEGTDQMVADEKVHLEVIRALAARGRSHMSGTFRAAVFGANDGLVSNLALVVGVGASGMSPGAVLLTGIAGLLAGAMSMGAGEWVSVRSQRELLEASLPASGTHEVLPNLDVNENELALVYRARGLSEAEAASKAELMFARMHPAEVFHDQAVSANAYEEIGSPWKAAFSSFMFFSVGAIIPVLPFFFVSGHVAIIIAAVLVGIALMFTGGVVGILSGTSPTPRAFRQLAIGYGAAAVTYLLGLLFGTTL